ncbi:MAG: OmpH family outer membrane protein [Acidobacteria bacterium]|nr:OmpH family outer membrane protein [Acidobacteriota bacterium]
MNIRRVGGLALSAVLLSCTPAFAQTKVAIINMEEAIARTQEGQRLMQEFQDKYAPRQQELEALQTEIQSLESQRTNGANTLSEDALRDLTFKIEQKQTQGQRLLEDARGELSQEQGRIFNEVGNKVVTVIDKYAQANGYSVVLNVSVQPNLILFAMNEVNITQAIIDAYDAENGGAPAAGAE